MIAPNVVTSHFHVFSSISQAGGSDWSGFLPIGQFARAKVPSFDQTLQSLKQVPGSENQLDGAAAGETLGLAPRDPRKGRLHACPPQLVFAKLQPQQ